MPTYTTRSNVQRVLNASSGRSVRFGDTGSIEIRPEDSEKIPNSDIQISVNDIAITDAFEGSQVYEVKFTDATTYDVYLVGNATDMRRILLDSGQSIAASYASTDGNITIAANTFSGTIETGDTVNLRFNVHMSNNNADAHIEDTEIIIDTLLQKMYIGKVDDGETNIYTTVSDVPSAVRIATTYLAAYYIYTDIFIDIVRDDNDNMKYLSRWRSKAETLLKDFAEVQGRWAPSVISFPKFAQYVGDDLAGPGTSTTLDDSDDIQRDTEADDIWEDAGG